MAIVFEKFSLQYHKHLNSKLFSDDDLLQPEVCNAFLNIATRWMKEADIPHNVVTDIIFTGGNANYNYSRFSDCDVHIVYDATQYEGSEIFLKAMKKLWSLEHKGVTVKGYPVELYAQASDDNLVASGVYSVLRNGWIKKPEHKEYNFKNDPALIKKVNHIKGVIDRMIDSDAPEEEFKAMRDKLKTMRNAGLAGGELSFDNSVFKALRNTGALDRMNAYLHKKLDIEMSI